MTTSPPSTTNNNVGNDDDHSIIKYSTEDLSHSSATHYRLENWGKDLSTRSDALVSPPSFEATAQTLYDNLSWIRKFFLYIDMCLVGGYYHKCDNVMDKGLSNSFLTTTKQQRQQQQEEESSTINLDVEVEVRATIVTLDTKIPNELEDFQQIIHHKTENASSHFVGVVHKSTNDNATILRVGDPVTSLIKCAVDSGHVHIPPQLLIPIPQELDAGESVALVSTYLPAFGALHHGNPKRLQRFKSNALEGLNILITGGGTNESDAVVKLAVLGGASKVFVLTSEERKTKYHVGSHSVLNISDDPTKWLPRVEASGDIDILIDLSYPKNFDALLSSLAPTTGRYVVVVPQAKNEDSPTFLTSIMRTLKFATYEGVFLYDLEEMIEHCYEDILNDLEYLFRKLETRKIRPSIDKYIKSRDVAIVQEDMKHNSVIGSVICEPWRR